MTLSTRARMVVEQALVLLGKRDWCQGAIARTRFLGPTEPRKRSAAYLDVIGALQLASHQTTNDWVGAYDEAFIAVDNHTRSKHGCELITFNDTIATCKQDIVNLFTLVLA